MRVAVVGLGYVGAVTAACLADLGHEIVGVDVDEQKVASIQRGESPIVEPGLAPLIAQGVASGALRASSNPGEAFSWADAAVVCVGTPTTRAGAVSFEFLERVTRDLGHAAGHRDRYLGIVYRSTMPPGSVEERLLPILRELCPGQASGRYGVAMTPEFLREGSGIKDFMEPPFTAVGTDDEQMHVLVTCLFGGLVGPVHLMSFEAAEALKYACNAFHAVKVTFANEIGRIVGAAGVDSRAVMDVLRSDRRLNASPAYLRPGFAFGGSCLPKDMRGLLRFASDRSVETPMLEGVLRSNELHIKLAARRVLDTGSREVALLGLSFKAETDDLRESPYVELAETLIGKGINLRIYDPIVNPKHLVGANRRFIEERLPHLHEILVSDPTEALKDREVAIVATRDVRSLSAITSANPLLVLDLVGQLDSEIEALSGYSGLAW